MPNVQDFLSLLRQNGLARKEKYQVNIFGPNVGPDMERDVSLLCEDASIPGVMLGTRSVRLNNLNVSRPATIDFMGQSSTFTFLLDGTWLARRYFDRWMEKIIDTNREVNEYINIIGRIEVISLAEEVSKEGNFSEKELYAVVLEEAFPKTISLLPVAYGSPGAMRMTVEFAFRRWKKKEVERTESQAPTTELSLPILSGNIRKNIPGKNSITSAAKNRFGSAVANRVGGFGGFGGGAEW